MSKKKLKPHYHDPRSWTRHYYPGYMILQRLNYRQAQAVTQARGRFLDAANDPALRPKPHHKPFKRREKRGQSKPR